jgi:hypothetical protein
LIAAPLKLANKVKSPGDGEGDAFGVGEGDAFGVGEAVGLGKTVGETLGVGSGEPLGLGLGLPVGVPDGDGVAVTVPKTPATITIPPCLISSGCPLAITGTLCPLPPSRLKYPLSELSILICPTKVLLIKMSSIVFSGRLTEYACTLKRRLTPRLPFVCSRYSAKPVGVIPLIAAPLSEA